MQFMNNLKLKLYQKNQFDIWNNFIENSNNGTIFHRLDFLDYHKDRFKDNEHHLIWYKGDAIYAMMPLGIFEENGEKIARSPFGASWGGLVHGFNFKSKYALKIVEQLKEYLKNINVNKCYITVAPGCYYKKYTNYFEFSLSAHGFSLQKRELNHIIPLPTTHTNISLSLDAKCRNQCKQSIKNFSINNNAEIEEFYDVLLEDKKRHDNATATHTLADLKHLKKIFPDRIFFHVATTFTGEKASVCYFKINNHTLMTFYLAQQNKALKKNGLNALLFKGLHDAVTDKIEYFDFGSSAFSSIEKTVVNGGVSEFKESFGARGYFRDTYFLEIKT